MIEVKSATNDREDFIDDMAYTTMVIGGSGCNVEKVSLLLVSKKYRLGMKNEDLFVEIDHTDEVLDRVKEFKPLWESIEKITRSSVKPEPELRFECRDCELFDDCIREEIANHIIDLPRLNQSKFDELVELEIVSIEDIPDDFPLNDHQARVRTCAKTKKPVVEDGLKTELESISWPAYYLDFETVNPAIPLYADIAPYAHIPTQYSIHKCSAPGHVLNHFEYLADPNKDSREELAESLISDLKGKGSIIAYSNFEKNIINSLIEACPNLSRELKSLTDRIIDLEAIVRNNFCHPDFHGRTSIKITLPVLVPEMSYDGLEIADGGSAMAAFVYMARGKYDAGEVEAIKRRLLDYCKQDTLAMVKLHESLIKHVL